jgi:iron complex transport system permease protein
MSTPRFDWTPFPSAHRRRPWALPISVLILAGLVVVAVCIGPSGVDVSARDAFRVIAGHTPWLRSVVAAPASDIADPIVWDIRLARALVAILIGSLLAMAGVALQGLLMNPLADPYTVGVSAGAAVGAALAEVAGFGAMALGFAGIGTAFAFGLGAVALVYALASVSGRVSVHTFLLAGVVVGSMLWSLIPLLMVLARRGEDLQRVMFYLIGSLQGASWSRAALLLPFAAISFICLVCWSRDLNLMTLGEESAAHLGVEIEPFKRRVLLVGSLATAAAVCVGGIIGFVGLVVPHVARRIVGPDHRRLLPLAAVFGGILLLASDLTVRAWLSDMPVGVVTSIVGAPVFCMLLRRRKSAAW